MIKPEAAPIKWWHYDNLHAELVAELRAGRDPGAHLRRRYPNSGRDDQDALAHKIIHRWPAYREALVESGEYQPDD